MAGKRKKYTPEQKQEILARLEASGLGITEFSKLEGISHSALIGWRKGRRPAGKTKRKGRFGPADPKSRILAVEAFYKSGLTKQQFAKAWGVGYSTLQKWVSTYEERGPAALEGASLRAGARKRGRKGIPEALQAEIIAVKKENPTFGLRKVKSFLNRFRGVDAAPNTIQKTLKKAELVTPPPRRRRRRSSKRVRRFERAKPMQLWQTDITYFSLTKHQQRCYLTVFLDDFSRYIVGWRLGLQQTGEFVMEALLDGVQRFGRPQEVLTDQGKQYFAWRGKTKFEKLLRKQGIKHVVARSHHPQTVGKCERLWKTIKDEFWERVGPLDLEEARERLAHFINHYNHFRPNQGIDNLVPADRFFGAEGEIRQVIEKALSENEIRLATGERPRPPTFLVGQIGGQAISLHGERGKIVVNLPGDAPKEIQCESVEHQKGGPHEREGNGTIRGEEGSESVAKAGDEAAADLCAAGEDIVAAGECGAEGACSGRGDRDPGVLDGANHEEGGGKTPEHPAAEGMAAVTARDIGYAGGVTGATKDPSQRSADEPERGPESAAEADQGAGTAGEAAGTSDRCDADNAGLPERDDSQGRGSGDACKEDDPNTSGSSQ
jgi:transposase InsO family protein